MFFEEKKNSFFKERFTRGRGVTEVFFPGRGSFVGTGCFTGGRGFTSRRGGLQGGRGLYGRERREVLQGGED